MKSALSSTEIRRWLDQPTTSGDPFRALQGIAKAFNDGREEVARDLVIRALARADLFAPFPGVLDALARQVGLFPYIQPKNLSPRDRIAYEFHRTDGLQLAGEDVVLHRDQAVAYHKLLGGKNLILSAPTSFGKSVLIDAAIATDQYDTIVIIVPTLALIDETRRRLARFTGRYKIVTHDSQVASLNTIYILTQERAVARDDLEAIDLLVIDEFYKLDPQTDTENNQNDRCITLNQALYKLGKKSRQMYLLGPDISEIPGGFAEKYRFDFQHSQFKTVVSRLHRIDAGDDRKNMLVTLCKKLNGQTLIYCKSPAQADEIGRLLASSGIGAFYPILDALREWIGQEFHPEWSFGTTTAKGIGIHHGGIPRALAQLNVALFNARILPILVCTTSLIEGVNTSARNVIVYENKVAIKRLDFFTFNNIRGRSGRMFQHYIGDVFIFDEQPQRIKQSVDIPAHTQDIYTPTALLLQLDPNDLTARSEERLEAIVGQEILSLETMKKNSPLDPEGQIRLGAFRLLGPQTRDAIRVYLPTKHHLTLPPLRGGPLPLPNAERDDFERGPSCPTNHGGGSRVCRICGSGALLRNISVATIRARRRRRRAMRRRP